MKNFIFKSRDQDLQKFCNRLELQLNLIQKELRHQRDDLSDIKRRETRIIGLLTDTAPVEREEEYPEEELGTTKDIHRGD